MSEPGQISLFELQRIDLQIAETRTRIQSFEPALEEVNLPVERLESEEESLRKRLQELKLDERRLTTSSEEKRARLDRLNERLNVVRNLREEAAVHAEADLVRRALEADEQEAFTVMDLVGKAEDRLEELANEVSEARAEIDPKRQELLTAQADEARSLDELNGQREACAAGVNSAELALYERIKTGGRAVAVSVMTEDGACGVCFNVIPLQLQNEIRKGASLLRCEACGVILAPPSAAPEPEPAPVTASVEPEESGESEETDEVVESVSEPE